MQFPLIFHIGSLAIPAHPVFEFLAFVFGYWYYSHLKKQGKISPLSDEAEWAVFAGMILGAFIGSRLTAGLEDPTLFLHPISALYYLGSQTIAGGVIGAIVGVEIAKKLIGLKRKTGDLFVFPLTLGIMIGRIGCLVTGVTDGTVGLPSSLPWAFDQGDGIPRHPTSAYEILFLLILFFVLKFFQTHSIKFHLREGDLFGIFVLGYATFRFFVEFIKPIHPIALGLSSIQLVSLAAMIYYLASFSTRLFKSKTYGNS